MRWVDALRPARMRRIAIVSPQEGLRAVLVALAAAGVMEIEASDATTRPAGSPAAAPRRAERPAGEATAHRTPLGSPSPEQEHAPRPGAADTGDLGGAAPVRLADVAVASVTRRRKLSLVENAAPRVREGSAEIGEWERTARWDLLAGERELEPSGRFGAGSPGSRRAGGTGPCRMRSLRCRRGSIHSARRWSSSRRRPAAWCPTLITGTRASRPFRPLVDTYAQQRLYADIDPTLFAGVAYVLMFGMMFGDAGHGLPRRASGCAGPSGRPARSRRSGVVWPFVFGAGVAATAFGLLYGEMFGLEPVPRSGSARSSSRASSRCRRRGRCGAAGRSLRHRDDQPLAREAGRYGGVRPVRDRRRLFLRRSIVAVVGARSR